MTAVNYARNRVTRELLFIGPGEVPADEYLDPEWAWNTAPKPHPRAHLAMTIGESPQSYAERVRRQRS